MKRDKSFEREAERREEGRERKTEIERKENGEREGEICAVYTNIY
jgi:hypothetical protein